jgi:DNA-binding transcriptional LysR family regulator
MDRFQVMTTFVRVVETGSFSAAARDLHMGQPAVSKAIAGLEDHLRTRLLVRSTRSLAPTEAGAAFYERAKKALEEADEAETAARAFGGGLEGRLRVSAPVTFARLRIIPYLSAFLDAHPGVRLELVLDDRGINLLEENIDVAFRAGSLLSDSSMTAHKIAQAPRFVVASPAYLARMGTPERPSDLLRHDAILFSRMPGQDEWRFTRDGVETSVRPRSRLSVSAAEGLREAVIAGLGLGVATGWTFVPELSAGTVTLVMCDWALAPVDLWAVYPAGRLPNAKARAFTTWVEGVLKAAPTPWPCRT